MRVGVPVRTLRRPSIRHFDRQPPQDRGPRRNEQIRITPIRLVGAEGEQLGIVPTAQALEKAREAGLDLVELDVGPPTFMRAPGECPGTFALESAMDELAHELGMDPVELRARNEPDKEPISGRPFSNRNLKEAYRLGAEKFGWGRRDPRPGSMHDERTLIGWGVATTFYPYYRFPASARVRQLDNGTALVPAIEVYWLDKPDPCAPRGAHGIGEIGITGVAAAVANAVFHATGKRVRDLPITPEKLL
jgi:CO/xanthine dehydrogenase Mo-binding subunit